jgi:murein endopeptidase
MLGSLPVLVLAVLAATARGPDPAVSSDHSIGHPFSGHLRGGIPLPATSPYHVTQSATRRERIFYGTAHLIRFIEDAAKRLSETYPGGAAMSVGNLSFERGGDISYSRSHNSGRDVDIAYLVETLDGKPAPSYYHRFGKNGHSVEAPRRFRLDLKRNWGLLKVMMTSTEAELEYFIVAPYIETMLLDYARSIGEDPETIRRASLMMMLPGYAKVHDNHIHVRVLCTPSDWAEKCVNGGAVWPWAPLMYGALEKLEAEVAPSLLSPDPAVRKAALGTLGSRHVDTAAASVAKLMTDADPAIAVLAIDTLVTLTTEATTQAVLEAAFSAPPKIAMRLLAAALPVAGPEALPTARAVVDGQHPAVSAVVPEKDRKRVTHQAAKVLSAMPQMAPSRPGGP